MISGPQQAHDVREHREREAGEDLLAHRRAADALAPLEHDDALAGAREIGGADEAVVAAADDDRVVGGRRQRVTLRANRASGRGPGRCDDRRANLRSGGRVVPSTARVLAGRRRRGRRASPHGSVASQSILERRRLPIIDLQATYVADRTNVSRMIGYMEELDVAQYRSFAPAFQPNGRVSRRSASKVSRVFVPTANSGEFPRWSERPARIPRRRTEGPGNRNVLLHGRARISALPLVPNRSRQGSSIAISPFVLDRVRPSTRCSS